MENKFESYFYNVFNKCGEDELYDLIIDLYNEYVVKNDYKSRRIIISNFNSMLSSINESVTSIKSDIGEYNFPYLKECIKFFLVESVCQTHGSVYDSEFDELIDIVNRSFDWE